MVVILSSSRSGSSLLFQLLRATGAFLCLPGEHTHLYKLHGLGLPPAPDAHDGTLGVAADIDGFAQSLLDDCSTAEAPQVIDADRCIADFARRIVGQWPFLAGAAEDVWHIVKAHWHFASARSRTSCSDPPERDPVGLLLDILATLREHGWPIDPWYYDVPADRIRLRFAALPRPSAPPFSTPVIVEEPPFLVPHPSCAITERDLVRPLLLKASVDAYRVELLTKIFPSAEMRFVHLRRNPAASINGLIDGWLDRGFFSHSLADRAVLAMDGYSDRPWGSSWWNFDLPPNWRTVTNRPLIDVCGFQWLQAHRAIVLALATGVAPTLPVYAEDVIASGRRVRAIAEVLHFAGVAGNLGGPAGPEPTPMTTLPPQAGRWRRRAEQLGPVLKQGPIRRMADHLGYGSEPNERWV